MTVDDEFRAYRERLAAMPSARRAKLLATLCRDFGVDAAPAMLSTADVARRLGVGVDTLEKWRAVGSGPPCKLLARTRYGRDVATLRSLPRYRAEDVEAWIKAQREIAGGPDPRRK